MSWSTPIATAASTATITVLSQLPSKKSSASIPTCRAAWASTRARCTPRRTCTSTRAARKSAGEAELNEHLRERLNRKLEALSDERGYQVLDYIEFLESKYAE